MLDFLGCVPLDEGCHVFALNFHLPLGEYVRVRARASSIRPLHLGGASAVLRFTWRTFLRTLKLPPWGPILSIPLAPPFGMKNRSFLSMVFRHRIGYVLGPILERKSPPFGAQIGPSSVQDGC